jgi:hypothetical protein
MNNKTIKKITVKKKVKQIPMMFRGSSGNILKLGIERL